MSDAPLITLFSAPKPFTHPHIDLIQRNAICSWKQLGTEVSVVLVGEQDEVADRANALGVAYLSGVGRNSYGTPLISSIFDLARRVNASPLMAYVNADIILLPDFLTAARLAMHRLPHFLLVGQRWDLAVQQALDFSAGWEQRLMETVRTTGRRHPPGGSDYFVFPRACYQRVPPFALGRAGWDNWMIYEARRQGWVVVDCSDTIRVVHQDHDYSHLPGGQPHYRLPESAENVRLAGGALAIFTLVDANWRMGEMGFLSPRWSWKKFLREVEIFPLVYLRSYFLAQLVYALFHPLRAFRQLRAWLRSRLTR